MAILSESAGTRSVAVILMKSTISITVETVTSSTTVGDRAGFERKGKDVYTNITIPFTTAVLGGEAVVPTLTGNVVCSIRPGTQSGSKIRLRGKGIVSMKDKNIHGDEYAVVQIQVPKNLNETAKEKLREFAKAC